MANILIGATGSVAAIKLPDLVTKCHEAGHDVRVVATEAACYFLDRAAIPCPVFRDADEWPTTGYPRGAPVLHIELRKWADLFLLAPLDANTLGKLAVGLCDNCLTCVWRAWDLTRPIVFAPAMNTLMWEHPFTRKHLRALAVDFGAGHIPSHLQAEQLVAQINDRAAGLHIVGPVTKTLACGDTGIGAMAEPTAIVAAAQTMLTRPRKAHSS
ncbi:MAG: hypothetical protein LC104_09735 [Bacteroidales bacterium]|nr:hypothetical protein [Bacteroidales bacterium]